MKTIFTPTEARADLYNIIAGVSKSHHPIHIRSKHGNTVLIAEEDWLAIEETLCLLSIPGMKESITKGGETPIDECLTEIDW